MTHTPLNTADEHNEQNYTTRRRAFPRGLVQPAGAYRFGLDALLLAAWTADCLPQSRETAVTACGGVPAPSPLTQGDATVTALCCEKNTPQAHAPQTAVPVAELGAGCGAAAAGLALLRSDVRLCALEREQILVDAALANTAALGFAERIAVLRGDIAEKNFLLAAGRGTFAAVMANPPWRRTQEGRQSPSALRRKALTYAVRHPPAGLSPKDGLLAEDDTAMIFAQAARTLLAHHGRYCCIFAAAGLPRLLAAVAGAKLGLRRLRFVHTRADRPAHAVLLEARKDARDDLRVEPPLLLHDETAAAYPTQDQTHTGQTYTAQARHFCPWLKEKTSSQ